jgi:hypothetical protein
VRILLLGDRGRVQNGSKKPGAHLAGFPILNVSPIVRLAKRKLCIGKAHKVKISISERDYGHQCPMGAIVGPDADRFEPRVQIEVQDFWHDRVGDYGKMLKSGDDIDTAKRRALEQF